MNNQKGLATIIILILVAVIGGTFLLEKAYNKPVITQRISQSSPDQNISDETSSWRVYTNTAWKISFKYPPHWQAITTQGESGMLVRSLDLKMTDYSNIDRGAFLFGPYAAGVLRFSWDKVFDEYSNEEVEILNENILVDGQETKVGLLRKANAVEMIVYYKYPRPWNDPYNSEIQWSFINLVTTQTEFDKNKEIFKQILSTFKFQ